MVFFKKNLWFFFLRDAFPALSLLNNLAKGVSNMGFPSPARDYQEDEINLHNTW
jgi:hypothetical protein